MAGNRDPTSDGHHLHVSDHRSARQGRHGDKVGESLTNEASVLDTTHYNESVLAPIRNAKKMSQGGSVLAPTHMVRGRGPPEWPNSGDGNTPDRNRGSYKLVDPGTTDEKVLAPVYADPRGVDASFEPLVLGKGEMGLQTPARNKIIPDEISVAESDCGSVIDRRKSAFEMMMASLEKSSTEEGREKVTEVIRGSPTFSSKGLSPEDSIYSSFVTFSIMHGL